jgi:hypothetical protein
VTAPREPELVIRSFRVVFDLERRIHRIERIRLPLPYGLPLRSVAYAGACFAVVLVAGRLPGLREVLAVLPTPVRLVLIPAAGAHVLTQLRPDGRSAHHFLISWARHRCRSRYLVALRPTPRRSHELLGEVVIAPDERTSRWRPAVVEGAGEIIFRQPVSARGRGRRVFVRLEDDEPLQRGLRLVLDDRQRAILR